MKYIRTLFIDFLHRAIGLDFVWTRVVVSGLGILVVGLDGPTLA